MKLAIVIIMNYYLRSTKLDSFKDVFYKFIFQKAIKIFLSFLTNFILVLAFVNASRLYLQMFIKYIGFFILPLPVFLFCKFTFRFRINWLFQTFLIERRVIAISGIIILLHRDLSMNRRGIIR